TNKRDQWSNSFSERRLILPGACPFVFVFLRDLLRGIHQKHEVRCFSIHSIVCDCRFGAVVESQRLRIQLEIPSDAGFIDNISLASLNKILRGKVAGNGWLSRSAENALGNDTRKGVGCDNGPFKFRDVLRLPHKRATACTKAFRADRYRYHSGLGPASLEREEAVSRAGIHHFV